MENNNENMIWAIDKIQTLATVFGKKIENTDAVLLLATELLNIVEDNEEIPAEGHRHSRQGIRKPIRRGDWLIATLAQEHVRWPLPLMWRKTYSKYWTPADGKAWQEMAGAE